MPWKDPLLELWKFWTYPFLMPVTLQGLFLVGSEIMETCDIYQAHTDMEAKIFAAIC
jgi:hypothetical protein